MIYEEIYNIGFRQVENSLFIKYTDGEVKIPYFFLSLTIGPKYIFILKNILTEEVNQFQSLDDVITEVKSSVREYKIRKLLN